MELIEIEGNIVGIVNCTHCYLFLCLRYLFQCLMFCCVYFQDLINEGHAASQLILQLHDRLVELDELNDKQKSVIMDKLAVSGA